VDWLSRLCNWFFKDDATFGQLLPFAVPIAYNRITLGMIFYNPGLRVTATCLFLKQRIICIFCLLHSAIRTVLQTALPHQSLVYVSHNSSSNSSSSSPNSSKNIA